MFLNELGKGNESMRSALWHVHHPAIISRELGLGTEAFTERGRLLTQIKDHIIKRAANAAKEVGFHQGASGRSEAVAAVQPACETACKLAKLNPSLSTALELCSHYGQRPPRKSA